MPTRGKSDWVRLLQAALVALTISGSGTVFAGSDSDMCGAVRDSLRWYSSGVRVFQDENGRVPTREELRRITSISGSGRDPWGNDWQLDNSAKFPVYSSGRDGIAGNKDDVLVDRGCPYARVDITADGRWIWTAWWELGQERARAKSRLRVRIALTIAVASLAIGLLVLAVDQNS